MKQLLYQKTNSVKWYTKFYRMAFVSLLVTIIFAACFGCSQKDVENEIVICSWGGAFQEAQRDAFFEPFEESTGIKIVEASYNAEYGKIKAMVDAKKVMWDVVDVETSALFRGTKEDLFEPIDYTIVDTTHVLSEAIHPFGIGTDFFSTVLAYSTNAFPPGTPHPRNWKDFWDIKKFPGRRSLRKDPRSTLEFALLADGVQPDSLYPLDVERAFRSLDRIKNHISVWWVSGHQPVQLLADEEVIMTSAFNGRVWVAKNIDAIPIDMVWNQAVMYPEWWVILKGSKHKKLAIKFIAFALSSERQAALSKLIPYGPTNRDALNYIDNKILMELPTNTKNLEMQVIIDGRWWSENEASIIGKWNSWLLSK